MDIPRAAWFQLGWMLMATELEEQVHCCQGPDQSDVPWICVPTPRHLIMVGGTWDFRDTPLKTPLSAEHFQCLPVCPYHVLNLCSLFSKSLCSVITAHARAASHCLPRPIQGTDHFFPSSIVFPSSPALYSFMGKRQMPLQFYVAEVSRKTYS